MNIDWSKAPDGFPIWLEDVRTERLSEDDHNRSSWACDANGEYTLYSNGSSRGWWTKSREGVDFIAHHRPAPWSGEGLPPVGTVCELWPRPSVDKTAVDHDRYKSQIGREVKIIAHHDIGGGCIAAVFAGENDFVFEYHSMIEGNFRPIRTAEQIAAEERTKAIDDLVKVTCINRGEAALIYDAGYRKQVQP